ncbi:hypothetical protein L9F63_018977, partial [Diploptera punctata]
YLLVSPKDRRVVIVESLLSPTVFKETLAQVLFRHFEVSSLLFVPSHLVSLCCLGVNTALILDIGYEEAVLIPVYEGVPVLHAWQAQPTASHAVESSLKEALLIENNNKLNLDEITVEDIKVRACFVTSLERSTQLETVQPPPNVLYQEGTAFSISGKTRESVYEVLFVQDNDQMSLATMILDAIVKKCPRFPRTITIFNTPCPIDMRRPLAENILVIGGTAMTPDIQPSWQSQLSNSINHLQKKTMSHGSEYFLERNSYIKLKIATQQIRRSLSAILKENHIRFCKTSATDAATLINIVCDVLLSLDLEICNEFIGRAQTFNKTNSQLQSLLVGRVDLLMKSRQQKLYVTPLDLQNRFLLDEDSNRTAILRKHSKLSVAQRCAMVPALRDFEYRTSQQGSVVDTVTLFVSSSCRDVDVT